MFIIRQPEKGHAQLDTRAHDTLRPVYPTSSERTVEMAKKNSKKILCREICRVLRS